MRLEAEGGCEVELWSYWLDGMDVAGWPVTVLIGGVSVSCSCGSNGQYAAASRISRGPVFGSVPMPVKMAPRFSVSTQMAAALMTARARAGRVAAGMNTARPTSRKVIASTTETTPPLEPTALATLRSIDA